MKWAWIVILLIIVFGSGVWVGTNLLSSKIGNTRQAQQEDKYPLLAKRIFLDNPSDVVINFTDLRYNLRDYIANSPYKIGIYFEYLFSGTSIGINDRDTFFAASLLKIPLTMEVQKQIELGEISPNEQLLIKEEHINKDFGDLWKKGVGNKITVKEAMHYSLVDSDNTAYNALRDRIYDRNYKKVYEYLDIPQDMVPAGGGISPKNFTSILKSLYFSAYLSYEKSNELLDIMAIPSEKDLLTRDIPSTIKVANKFGVYTSVHKEEQVFSDCGIFYIPERRYALCVMVQGVEDRDVAGKQISEISKIVYDFVVEANPSDSLNNK